MPPTLPVVTKKFNRVLGAVRAIATQHVTGRAVFVASPAKALWVGGMNMKIAHNLIVRYN